jgi:cytochrome c oxidase subunit 2
MVDGAQAKVDENYIRESILEPNAKVLTGYEPIMPTFKGMLRDREVLGVIEFIKTLK